MPDGARTRWEIAGGQEIITWVLFDPAAVAGHVPRGLRCVTLAEMAESVPASTTTGQTLRSHLAAHPEQRHYAASFVEIWGGAARSAGTETKEPARRK